METLAPLCWGSPSRALLCVPAPSSLAGFSLAMIVPSVRVDRMMSRGGRRLYVSCIPLQEWGALLRSPPQFSQVLLPKAATGKEKGNTTIALD